MQGAIEALVSGILKRGLSPTLATILMATPSRKVVRAQLKRIYALDDRGEMTGEYVLDADCPIDYNDFLKVLPAEGIGDRESLFVGEYVFTAFQSGNSVFVLLSRGSLARDDVDWTSLVLAAAESHLAQAADAKPDLDRALADREASLLAREKTLAAQEAKLQADGANLLGREDEVNRQKAGLAARADYVARMQDSVTKGASRAMKTLEITERLVANQAVETTKGESKSTTDERQSFEQERKALLAEKNEVEARYREAATQIAKIEREAQVAVAALEKERAQASARMAEEEQKRHEIESHVASHRNPSGEADETRKAMEGEKAEHARERKFLQRRAIELLDREERVRDREGKADEREHELARRVDELTTREQDVARQKAVLAQTSPAAVGAVREQADEAKKDIERRVKIIQQKALELLDREEKLRRRAAELEAMEARLSGRVTAE